MNRQPHDAGLKAQAKALYESDGPKLASDVTSIPKRTINAWAKAEGWQRTTGPHQATGQRPDLRVAGVAETRQPTGKSRVVAIGYGYQRRALLRRLAGLAALALDQVETELRSGHTVKARDGMVVCGIALDKAEQLAKAAGPDLAGDRPDAAEAVARLQEMAAELATRKTGSDGQPS
jgi:hypothetical protein